MRRGCNSAAVAAAADPVMYKQFADYKLIIIN